MKVRIIYFSGTGNTKLISEVLKNSFAGKEEVKLVAIEDYLKGKSQLDLNSSDVLIGVGFPIYDLLAPNIIHSFIEALPKAHYPIPVFIFSSMAFIKGDCHSIVAKALKKKGYYTISKIGFKCPSNGVATYEKPEHSRYRNVRFEKGIKTKILYFAVETINAYNRFLNKPFHRGGLIIPIYNVVRYFSEKLYGDKYYLDLRISNRCNVCKACVQACPDQNLKALDNRIIIKNDNGCLRCLRCVSLCPKNAISFTSTPKVATYSKQVMMKLYNEANGKA